ncbi:hypothetical protein BAE44_0009525 [Dichanthelium oligosanthes]|uniref:R13L1/DRL21-like LRR repeat region domain-containing protein n=1 Tax=Dichanthelium oligosanthes TaxID=888268 RepID=A0A1E5VWG4_9POAL|nr:hypothetical protein BAE44_0009525 [Dichanthelium oligosanthes]
MDIAPDHLPLLERVDMVDLTECTSLPPLGRLPNLKILSLEGMHGITKIDGDLSSSSEIPRALSRTNELFMKGNDNPDMPNWTGELRKLHSLHVSTTYPELKASSEVMSKLTSLRLLTLSNCERMASLPESLGDLASLQELRIDRCPNLNNLNKLISLHMLTLFNCESMAVPEWLGDLACLRELRIDRCPNLNNLNGVIGRLSSLQSLQVTSCENIQELTESLGSLTSLMKLEVIWCRSIRYLPESIPQLPNLEDLAVICCPELKAWCESEDKAKFPNIHTPLSRAMTKEYEANAEYQESSC